MQQSQQLHHQGAASEQDMAYITGAKRAPIPTFFIDAASGHDFVESHPDGGDLAKNVRVYIILLLLLLLLLQLPSLPLVSAS